MPRWPWARCRVSARALRVILFAALCGVLPVESFAADLPAVVGGPEVVPSSSSALPLPQHPAGSILSVVQADQALRDARVASSAQEKAFVARREACYGKLVAEPCLRAATEDNARAERHIHSVEVEARGFKRQQADRDARAAREAQRARATADAPRKQAETAGTIAARKQQAERHAKAARDFEAAAPERAARAASEKRREQERIAARQRKNKDEAARASERRDTARAHEAKVEEVLKRAQEKEARAEARAREQAGRGAGAGKS